MWIVLWSRVRQSCASPVKSMNTPEHGEHLVVLGPRGAQRQCARLLAGNRRIRLEDRLDHASADATVLVDVVDEDLGGLLLVAAVKSTKSAIEA